MKQVYDIKGHIIDKRDMDRIINSIIDVLSKEKITYAVAYIILEKTKEELENTVFKKSV